MTEFKDASLWVKLAFLMTMLGFLCALFGFAIGVGGGTGSEGCFIAGFIFFLVAVVLILCLVLLDELKGNKPALIVFFIAALIAGICLVLGVALWGGHNNKYRTGIHSYSATVSCCGALMAILAGIFGILELAGVKAKCTSIK